MVSFEKAICKTFIENPDKEFTAHDIWDMISGNVSTSSKKPDGNIRVSLNHLKRKRFISLCSRGRYQYNPQPTLPLEKRISSTITRKRKRAPEVLRSFKKPKCSDAICQTDPMILIFDNSK